MRAQAGALILPAGQYTLDLEGSTAIFQNVDTGKKFTTQVKIVQTPTKFKRTSVQGDVVNGMERVRTIYLGGSTSELDFSGS